MVALEKVAKNACMHPFPLKTYLLCGNMFADPCSFFTDPDLDPTFYFQESVIRSFHLNE